MSKHAWFTSFRSEKEGKIRNEIETFKKNTFENDVIHTIMNVTELTTEEIKANIPEIHHKTKDLNAQIMKFLNDKYGKYKPIERIKREYLNYFNPLYYSSYDDYTTSLKSYQKVINLL